MSQTQAFVETLTAEVRVLMVGNRQITLSVARQLDEVPLSDLRVMGRVKIGNDFHHVIGSAPDGTLAVARYRPHLQLGRGSDLILHLEAGDLPEGTRVCSRGQKLYDASGNEDRAYTYGKKSYYRFVSSSMTGRPILVNTAAVKPCAVDHRQIQQPCAVDWWSAISTLGNDELQRQHLEQLLKVELHRAAEEAPLIVLAGLK